MPEAGSLARYKTSPYTCTICHRTRYLDYHGRYRCPRCEMSGMCPACYGAHQCPKKAA